MCFFKKKKKVVITGNKYQLNQPIKFKRRDDVDPGVIYNIKQLDNGEIVYDETKQSIKVGDGSSRFSNLDYIGYAWEMDQEYDFGDIDDGAIIPGPDDEDYDFGDLAD